MAPVRCLCLMCTSIPQVCVGGVYNVIKTCYCDIVGTTFIKNLKLISKRQKLNLGLGSVMVVIVSI